MPAIKKKLRTFLIPSPGDKIFHTKNKKKSGRNRLISWYSISFTSEPGKYILSVIIITLVSAISYPFADYMGYESVSFILLFTVSILATFMGIGPILVSSTFSALLWDYFFIPPHDTFHIGKPEDVLMFFMFFFIALVNGVLTARVRKQERLTRDREERTNALFQLTRALSSASGIIDIIKIATENIKKNFFIDTVFILQDGKNQLKDHAENNIQFLSANEYQVATQAFTNSKDSSKSEIFKSPSGFLFYQMKGANLKPGVIGVKFSDPFSGDQETFWEAFLTQIANALEREFLEELARKARFLDESDKLYKTLFNSISHELRIPVATIMGASETLVTGHYQENIREELSKEIFKASIRLNRLIENLLNMSRLETGRISPRIDWCDIHDLINKVVSVLSEDLKSFHLIIDFQENMPLIKLDFGLMEQVLYNLLYNSCQYASPGTNIRIKVFYKKYFFYLQVMDRGPGIPQKSIPLIFDKFYRVEGTKTGGTGIGLSIVKGFVEAHKGTVTVENRANGGLVFTLKIPSGIPELNELSNNE